MQDSIALYLVRNRSSNSSTIDWEKEEQSEIKAHLTPTKVIFLNPWDSRVDSSDVKASFGKQMLQLSISDVILADARSPEVLGDHAALLWAKLLRIPVLLWVSAEGKASVPHPPFLEILSDERFVTLEEACASIRRRQRDMTQPVKGPEVIEEAIDYYQEKKLQGDSAMLRLLRASNVLQERSKDCPEWDLEALFGKR